VSTSWNLSRFVRPSKQTPNKLLKVLISTRGIAAVTLTAYRFSLIRERGFTSISYWRGNLAGELFFRSPLAPLAISNSGSTLKPTADRRFGPNLHRGRVPRNKARDGLPAITRRERLSYFNRC